MKKYIKLSISIGLCLLTLNIQGQSYNRQAAIAYAEKWWDKFNNTNEDGGPYRNYTQDGGDCAAFVSQCLIAGGLDLSKGTNGNGAYVKPDRVIAGVKQLVEHLQKYQIVKYELIKDRGSSTIEPSFVKPGDPVFMQTGEYWHSILCVDIKEGRNVYNCHTKATYQKKRSYWDYSDSHCFRIGSDGNTPPPHCENCKQDEGETGVDCGGNCPPCNDAPENNQVNSNNIQPHNFSLNNLSTVGNLRISSGQEIIFLSGNEVTLNPGFEIQSGAEFSASTSNNRDQLTRSFRKVCVVFIPNVFTPNNDGINDKYGIVAAGLVSVHFDLLNRDGKRLFQKTVPATNDGFIDLWDGYYPNGSPAPQNTPFIAILKLKAYDGQTFERHTNITIIRE